MHRPTSNVIERVSKDARISKTQATKALDELYRWVSSRLKERDTVDVGGFGTFTHADNSGKTSKSHRLLPDSQIVFIPKSDRGRSTAGKSVPGRRKDTIGRRQGTTPR